MQLKFIHQKKLRGKELEREKIKRMGERQRDREKIESNIESGENRAG